MNRESPKSRASIVESPWYWLYLFCTAGLVALVLAGPKFSARQSQIERSSQGRQRAIQNLEGRDTVTPMSDESNTQIRLLPLYVVLGILLAFAWINLGWRHFKQRRRDALSTAPHDSSSLKAT